MAQKNVLAARARPRVLASTPTDSISSGSAILDSTLIIFQSASHFIATIQERYKEVSIIGTSFSGDISPQLKEKLSNVAKGFSASITELGSRTNAVAAGGEE